MKNIGGLFKFIDIDMTYLHYIEIVYIYNEVEIKMKFSGARVWKS